ncbi:nuclease SbcCD subunit D [Geomonas sp. Red276]
MRLIHTSDWHLGHTLHDVPRDEEHQAFLDWLLQLIGDEAVDALVVCGDIFDTANPSSQAQALWYGFMARARRLFPTLDVLVIGGNHDSAARLDAPEPLFRAFGVRVVGGFPTGPQGEPDWDRLIVPLHRADGSVGARVAAVPFLRPADLAPVAEEGVDPLVEGVRRAYAEVLVEARKRCGKGEALLATGHCYMTGGVLSELSERKILGGNQHALPVDIFDGDVAYVALGHLHYPQAVGGRKHVRYSGSPVPLSLSEARYPSQVCLVELEGEICSSVREIAVPRTVDMLRIPERGALSIEELLERLAALPDRAPGEEGALPYLEVSVQLDKPEPGLRARVAEALEGKRARLMKITPTYGGTGTSLAGVASGQGLHDLTAEEVFIRRYQSFCGQDPSAEVLEAFHEIIEQVGQEERG